MYIEDTCVIAVTADEYEEILCVEKTAAELEKTMNLKKGSVNASISKKGSGSRTGMRFYRVAII